MKYIHPIEQMGGARDVHPSLKQHHITPINADLHVLTVVTNPPRFYSRYKLYQAFEKHVLDSGGIPWTIELAFRDRHFEVTDPNNPNHIQLRSPAQLWHKENLLNILLRRLPANFEYVAWVDADVHFLRPDWVTETVHMLQHHKVIQMFSHALDLGPDFQPLTMFDSFMYSYSNGRPWPTLVNSKRKRKNSNHYYHMDGYKWHPGYAWAARRSALNDLGGLGEIAILGSGDHHMACALIGKVNESIHNGASQAFKDYWNRWQDRAEQYIKRDVGYMNGLICHYWHGKKQHRKYIERWDVLIRNDYDPTTDIYRDAQGVFQLSGNKPKLRDDLRAYFAQRNEDGIDI